MKWHLLALILCCISITATAQLHLAFRAGAQLDYAAYRLNGTKVDVQSTAGFQAGLLSKVYFDDKVSFVSGFFYNAKGYKVATPPNDTVKTYRLNYFEIPVMIQVDLSKERGKGFYAKAGPSVGIGISGREKYTGNNGQAISNKVVLSMTGRHIGLFDAAFNAGLGYEVNNRFFTELNYALGIGNLNNDPADPNIKTRVLSLSIGYFFK